jgi:hypothetical protein
MEEVGIRVCHMPSSPATKVIKKAWRWSCFKCYMAAVLKPRCFGMRLENGRFSDPTFCKKPRRKFVWLGRTCQLRNRGRRATPVIGEESRALKLEILCTSSYHLWEVCTVLRYEATSNEVHWSIQDFGEERRSSLAIGVATTVVWCAWRVVIPRF